MYDIVEASQSSTQELQEQIDMYKEKNRKEMTELQKQLREGGLELEKSRLTAKTLQEEVGWRRAVISTRFYKNPQPKAKPENKTKHFQIWSELQLLY